MVILFDLDGTLIDSTEAILESFEVSFKTLGGNLPSPKDIKSQIGHPLNDMYRALKVPEDRVDEYVNCYKEHYREIHTSKTVLLNGAKEAIELASSFAKLGVVTTKTSKYSRELLEYFGVMEYFDILIGREDVEHPKPHPEPILKALEYLKEDTKNSFMIGDTCLDILSAKRANVEAIGVSCGYGLKEDLLKCGAKVCDSSLKAVTFIKEKLN